MCQHILCLLKLMLDEELLGLSTKLRQAQNAEVTSSVLQLSKQSGDNALVLMEACMALYLIGLVLKLLCFNILKKCVLAQVACWTINICQAGPGLLWHTSKLADGVQGTRPAPGLKWTADFNAGNHGAKVSFDLGPQALEIKC